MRLSDYQEKVKASPFESTYGSKVSTDNHGLDHVHLVVSYDGLDCNDAYMIYRHTPIFPNHRNTCQFSRFFKLGQDLVASKSLSR